jgi:hypothetical protein
MTPENLLLSAVSGLLTALLWVVKRLWDKSEICDADRIKIRADVSQLQHEHLQYIKENASALAVLTANNTLALEENTKALRAFAEHGSHTHA